MSTDTRAVIGTIVGTCLVLGGLLSAQIAGINARFNDVNTRIGDVHRRIDDVQAEIRELRDDMQSEIRELRALVIDALKGSDPAD